MNITLIAGGRPNFMKVVAYLKKSKQIFVVTS